jgi:hypothetical protein
MKREKIDGETWYQWAQRQFEFSYCDECGKGVRGHVPVKFMGHWLAYCISPKHTAQTRVIEQRVP